MVGTPIYGFIRLDFQVCTLAIRHVSWWVCVRGKHSVFIQGYWCSSLGMWMCTHHSLYTPYLQVHEGTSLFVEGC